MSKLILIAALVAFLSITALAAPLEEVKEANGRAVAADGEDYRLPTEIRPSNYVLHLTPYLQESDGTKQFTFDGEVTITINSTVNTSTLILHSKSLNYTTSEYWSATNATRITLPTPTLNSVTDKAEYTLPTPLEAGKEYYLHFVYNGTLDTDMYGFYRSSYVDEDNVTKWLASTQFQTHRARRTFPSFDEPNFKATFNVTIRRPKSYNSYSNTRILSTVTYDDYDEDTYNTTPYMSTYILAFIVAPFSERKNDNFGIIARPEYYNQTEYSFEVGQQILSQLDNYFGLNYYDLGNNKMDMAAIPDFSAGAMENWGLLTYRERGLLYDANFTSLSAKQYIAAVVAHEQTHMWFGDLVTCDWWSYTWLNEGFARYFQYFGTAMVETEMGLDQQFVVDQIQVVMVLDSTSSSNPMSDEDTNTPSDLSRMFNTISYNKGASIIRMVKHAIGEDNFKTSLQSYLNKYKYTNTVPENLLEQWQAEWPNATKEYSEAVFRSFTEQVGYPVITVTLANDKKSFTLAQNRFLLNENDTANATLLYTVPITYTTSNISDFETTTPQLYLNAVTTPTNITLDSSISWLIVNIQETGYYRVNYDESTWHAIHHALLEANWSGIHELNRAQIVDDLLNLARAKVIEYDLALEVLEYLSTENNYLPWTSAFTAFSVIEIRLGADTQEFGEYILELLDNVYNELGFEERTTDKPLQIYNRAKVLAWACKYGHEECIRQSKEHFAQINTTEVPVNLRSVVYCNALRYGSVSDYDTLFNKFLTSKSATEDTVIIAALGCVKDETSIAKYFWAIVSDNIRLQDKSTALSALYTSNNENVLAVFELVTNNVDALATSLGSYSSVATVISNIAARFTTENELNKLKSFNEANSTIFGSAASTLTSAEATVVANIQWASARLPSFKSYLVKRRDNGAATNTVAVLTLIVCAIIGRFLQ